MINGRIDVIGTRETEILNALTSEKATSRSTVPIDVSLQTSNLLIKIGEAPESLGDINADIWILPYHSRIQSVEVEAGENAGRTLNYANVVVGMTRLGSYSGKPVTIEYGMPDSEIGSPDACAVLVQLRDAGPIIGAHRVDMEDAS